MTWHPFVQAGRWWYEVEVIIPIWLLNLLNRYLNHLRFICGLFTKPLAEKGTMYTVISWVSIYPLILYSRLQMDNVSCYFVHIQFQCYLHWCPSWSYKIDTHGHSTLVLLRHIIITTIGHMEDRNVEKPGRVVTVDVLASLLGKTSVNILNCFAKFILWSTVDQRSQNRKIIFLKYSLGCNVRGMSCDCQLNALIAFNLTGSTSTKSVSPSIALTESPLLNVQRKLMWACHKYFGSWSSSQLGTIIDACNLSKSLS